MTHLVLPFHRMEEAAPYLDPKRLHYLHEGQSESFESFEDFDLLAFDWYDIHSDRTETAKILVYVTQEALFFFCESQPAETCVQGIMGEILEQEGGDLPGGTGAVPVFSAPAEGGYGLSGPVRGGSERAEAHILSGTQATKKDVLHRIIAWRRELLRLKRYYEQLSAFWTSWRPMRTSFSPAGPPTLGDSGQPDGTVTWGRCAISRTSSVRCGRPTSPNWPSSRIS